ncbi:MAG: multicopper oxidase family protein [Pseudomonadota bacterium]
MTDQPLAPELAAPLTRRTLLSGATFSGAALAFPGLGWAQTGASDGFQVIHAGRAGPTLRLKRGEEVRVRLLNDTPEPAAIHWHGVRVPNAMDGVPGLTQAPVEPGGSFDYRFIAPDAGTFWYRPATSASGQRMRGPAGALIVSESELVEADREAVLLVSEIPNAETAGHLTVQTNQRLRFRIINAMATPLPLRLDKHRATVMAIDGQPAEPFAARDGRITLGPGNRTDLFLDATLAAGDSAALLVESASGDMPLLRLVYEGAPRRPAPLPVLKSMPANPLPERMDFRGALRIDVPLEAKSLGRGAPLFRAKRGRTVVLAIANKTSALQMVHLHGHSVRLLDKLDDGWKPFWLDTVAAAPEGITRVAFVADNPGKWLIESQTAAAWFEVV